MTRSKAQRMQARAAVPVNDAAAKDSFQNLSARLGQGAGNMNDGASYSFSPVSRNRAQLEYMYRGSWIIGVAVDSVADDMTRAGVDFASGMKPDELQAVHECIEYFQVWQSLASSLKWARLYGGSIAVILIDGQKFDTPLRIDTVAKGQFKGLLALDRWNAMPSVTERVTEFGPDLGKPAFYEVQQNSPALGGLKIHHSRVVRFDGVELPWQQRIAEQGWGMSVVERLYDRLVAFDSTTAGAAQLVHKAHLRTLKIDGLKQILGAGGPAFNVLCKQIEEIRRFQTIEGLTVIDSTDDMAAQSYSFTGLDDLLIQFGQQISGALQIPLVRLFGQSPAGLNSSGESDLRIYYDGIKAQQERSMRGPLTRVFGVMCQSLFGGLPDGFGFDFNSLWDLSDDEKAEVANKTTAAVVGAYDAGLISQKTALQELRQSSEATGIFATITDEDIDAADEEPPQPTELATPLQGQGSPPDATAAGGKPDDKLDEQNEPGKRDDADA
jgi:phage-related protein (TIGR01555 family)